MLKRSDSSFSANSIPLPNRRNLNDPTSIMVRYDYSSTYFENDGLEAELEDKKYFLQRRKYRASIDGDEDLKKEKQYAEKLLSLKEKVNRREPNESSNRISKFSDYGKSKPQNKTCKEKNKLSKQSETMTDENDGFDQSDKESNAEKEAVHSESSDVIIETETKSTENATKPVNNLTMFVLAFQKFKISSKLEQEQRQTRKDDIGNDTDKLISAAASRTKAVKHSKNIDSVKDPKRKASIAATSNDTGNAWSSRRLSKEVSTRKFYRRPATVPANFKRSLRHIPTSDSVPEAPAYGISVQKDFSRSRRKLEEISRLEQDLKYKYVNKYEERRKRLLADCKDTRSLQDRIQKFLNEVDRFINLDKSESSLDRVLRRSKSAYIFRDTESGAN